MNFRGSNDSKRSRRTSAEVQASREADDRRIIWTFLWTLFAFKIGTVIVIAWMAGASDEANAILAATTWPFLILPMIAVAGPLAYYYRLRRVRARREELLRSEWMLD